jgi:uncharacterized protein
MDITPLSEEGRKLVQGYGKGRIRISGEVFETPVAVTPESVMPWPVDPAALAGADGALALSAADFPVRREEADVLLLGCGARALFVPPALRAALREKGFSLDAMDTGAACRTYNALMMEGRRVCALLIPV